VNEFARFLRENRERRGLSLDELAVRTKIQRRYLAAMEDGDFAQLPGAAYRQAFVKSYARELGLDVQEVLERYSLAVQPPGEEPMPLAEQTPGLWHSAWLVFLLLSLLAAGVLGGWYASRRLQLMQEERRNAAYSVHADMERPTQVDQEEGEDEGIDFDGELRLSYFGPGEFSDVELVGE
jgi:cytoskeletal protein RodZ